jgi:hypothetical protein
MMPTSISHSTKTRVEFHVVAEINEGVKSPSEEPKQQLHL